MAAAGAAGALSYRVSAVQGGSVVRSVTASVVPVVLSGLTNGATYTVTVEAKNSLPAYGPAASATGVPSATVLTLAASRTLGPLGTRVTLSGTVRRLGAPVANAPVAVQETYSDGKLVAIGAATTLADGTWKLSFVPVYNGHLKATSLGGTSPSVYDRVSVVFTKLTARRTGTRVSLSTSTAPGFITSSSRKERVQILEVGSSGHVRRILGTVNASARHSARGQAHGVNTITFTTAALSAGTHHFAVKVIGTPVNTGATSKSVAVFVP